MKRSPVVAVVVGVALVLYIYTSSVKPSLPTKNVQLTLSEQIQEALSNIKNSDSPEAQMQGVLQMRALADKYPENADLQWNMGVFSMQSGQYNKAISRFEKVIELDESRYEAHLQLAVSHLALQDTSQATTFLSFLIDESEGNVKEKAAAILEKLK